MHFGRGQACWSFAAGVALPSGDCVAAVRTHMPTEYADEHSFMVSDSWVPLQCEKEEWMTSAPTSPSSIGKSPMVWASR